MKRSVLAALGAVATLAGSVWVAPDASAAGTCGAYRPTLQYAYASCSGVLDTGYIRVQASVCNSRGCYSLNGPYVSKASGNRSEIRVGTGYSLTNVTFHIQSS